MQPERIRIFLFCQSMQKTEGRAETQSISGGVVMKNAMQLKAIKKIWQRKTYI